MPGGNEEAWPYVKDVLQSISAKSDGEPCCQWVGDEGAGHYVKMVHNGIEYGDMQLICEAYDIMKRGLGMSNKEMGDVFAKWNKGVLDSFLIEITRDIVRYRGLASLYPADHNRCTSKTTMARLSLKRFSTRPARKERANGQQSTPWTSACLSH